MPILGIDMQSGFDDDEVVIRVNGEEFLHRDGVTTRRVLGLAESMRREVDRGPVTVEVSVPRRSIERRFTFDVESDTYLGLSLEGDDVDVIVRHERFGYA